MTRPRLSEAGVAVKDDEVLAELERLLRSTPRTGVLTAVVRIGLVEPDDDAIARMAEHIDAALRSDDVVGTSDTGVTVLLRGVQDLRNAVQVARRMCELVQQIASACAGVTILNRGEATASVSLRAQGALDLALGGGPGTVVSSPPLTA